MKKIILCLLTSMVLLFSACGSEEVPTAYPNVNEVEGATLSLKEDGLKKNEGVFVLTNNSDVPMEYSTAEFHMEEKKDGAWREFIGTAQSTWASETTTLAAGDSVEIPLFWKTLCGPIAKGTEYRIIILVNDSPMAVEFQLS